jgi:hypothetical protein
MKKMGDFRRIGVSGCVWEKREMGGVWVVGGGWVDRRRAGGGVSAVGEVVGGGGLRGFG